MQTKYHLNGKEINLTSEDITIASDNFNIDKNGHVTIKSGDTFDSSNLEVTNETESSYVVAGALNCRKKDYDGNEGTYGINYFGIGYSEDELLKYYIDGQASIYGVRLTIGGDGEKTTITPNLITTPKLTQTSLESIKKNISKADINALDIINNSDIYNYNLKSEQDTDKKHFGFVIGEKYNTPDEVLSGDKQGIDTYSMSSIMWKAIQELSEENKQLRKELEEVKNGQN